MERAAGDAPLLPHDAAERVQQDFVRSLRSPRKPQAPKRAVASPRVPVGPEDSGDADDAGATSYGAAAPSLEELMSSYEREMEHAGDTGAPATPCHAARSHSRKPSPRGTVRCSAVQ